MLVAPLIHDPMFQADILKAIGFLGSWQADYAIKRFRAERGVAEAFGLRPDLALHGVPIDMIERAFFPDDFDLIQGLRAALRASPPGKPHRTRYRLSHPSGNGFVRIESHQMIVRDPAGRTKRSAGTLMDVTALEEPAITGAVAEAVDGLGRLDLPLAEALPKIDKLAADLVAVCRQARAIGLSGLETDLKPALARVSRALSHGFRRAVHH